MIAVYGHTFIQFVSLDILITYATTASWSACLYNGCAWCVYVYVCVHGMFDGVRVVPYKSAHSSAHSSGGGGDEILYTTLQDQGVWTRSGAGIARTTPPVAVLLDAWPQQGVGIHSCHAKV
jgi:hypothetical protein